MITKESARPEISMTCNQKENQAGNEIIDAEAFNTKYCASNILNGSLLERTVGNRPANEDMIRGVV